MKTMLTLLSVRAPGCSAVGESNGPGQQPGIPGLLEQSLASGQGAQPPGAAGSVVPGADQSGEGAADGQAS